MIAFFPLSIPGFCFYFNITARTFLIGIPFIIVISNEKRAGNLFIDPNRIGFIFSADHFSVVWKGKTIFFLDYLDTLFGEECYEIVESTMGSEEKLYTYDGVWQGYRAILARKRKRLPFRHGRRPAFILTAMKDKVFPNGHYEMVFSATSINDAVMKYRAVDMLMARLSEMEKKNV